MATGISGEPRKGILALRGLRSVSWLWGAAGVLGGLAMVLSTTTLHGGDVVSGLLLAHPAMWLIDLSPLVLGALCYLLSRRQETAMAAARQSVEERRRYDAMLGALAEGVFVYGRDGLSWVNDEGARMWLATREDLLAHPTRGGGAFVEYLRPDGTRARMGELPTIKTFETGEPHRNELLGVRRRVDGSIIYLRASAAPLWSNTSPLDRVLGPDEVIVAYTDVTEQVLAERALAQRAREEEALNLLRSLLAEGAETQTLMQAGAERAAEVLRLRAVAISARQPDGSDALVASTGFDDAIEVGDVAQITLRRGASVEVETGREVDPVGATGGVIPSTGEPLGVLAAYHRLGETFSAAELQFLESIAGVLGWAIERAESSKRIRASEEKFRRLVESSPEPITVHARGLIVYANAAAAQMLGVESPADVIGSPEGRFLHPDSLEMANRLAERVRGSGDNEAVELQYIRADGAVVDVEVVAFMTTYDGESAIQLMLRDVTARKRAEEALRVSQRRLSEILDIAPDAIITLNAAYQIMLFNNAAEEMFGFSAPEVIGRSFIDLVPLDSQRESDFMGRFLGEPELSTHGSVYGQRKDGSQFPADASVSCAQVGEETVVTVIIRDITSRRAAEAAIRAEHAQQERLLGAITSVMVGVDADLRVTLWNAAAGRTFGIQPEDALRMSLGSLGLPWDWEAVEGLLARSADDGVSARIERLPYRQQDGQEGFLTLTANPVLSRAGRSGFLLVADDITARVALEAQLAQAQKLESIGQLAAGIAHEINTPTQFVGDNTRFLKDAFSDIATLLDEYETAFAGMREGHPDPESLGRVDATAKAIDLEFLREEVPLAIDQSLDGIDRVSKIVRAMKEFSHPGSAEMVPVNLNDAISSTLTVARNEWKYVADVEMDLDADLPLVPCLPGEFNQVILNIVINAAHALAEKYNEGAKGMIRVSTRAVDGWAEIAIADNGPGVPADIQSRVFDPFFTTKEVGRGTGQGLSLARSVVMTKHHGTLTLHSIPGEGATFTIRLPLAAGELVASA